MMIIAMPVRIQSKQYINGGYDNAVVRGSSTEVEGMRRSRIKIRVDTLCFVLWSQPSETKAVTGVMLEAFLTLEFAETKRPKASTYILFTYNYKYMNVFLLARY